MESIIEGFLFGTIIGAIISAIYVSSLIKESAIKAGVAYYSIVNDKNGKTEFRWKKF